MLESVSAVARRWETLGRPWIAYGPATGGRQKNRQRRQAPHSNLEPPKLHRTPLDDGQMARHTSRPSQTAL